MTFSDLRSRRNDVRGQRYNDAPRATYLASPCIFRTVAAVVSAARQYQEQLRSCTRMFCSRRAAAVAASEKPTRWLLIYSDRFAGLSSRLLHQPHHPLRLLKEIIFTHFRGFSQYDDLRCVRRWIKVWCARDGRHRQRRRLDPKFAPFFLLPSVRW